MKRIVLHDTLEINTKQIIHTNCAVLLDRMAFFSNKTDFSPRDTFEYNVIIPPNYGRKIVSIQRT
jgi:hypothetical protein